MKGFIIAVVAILWLSQTLAAGDRETAFRQYLDFGSMVKGGQVTPGWILAGPEFWYAEGGPQDRVIYRVNPAENTETELFDVEKLRTVLAGTMRLLEFVSAQDHLATQVDSYPPVQS